jgi:hypothetical protein
MITAPVGADFDFEDVAVGGAGDFRTRLAATRTTLLFLGQNAHFVLGVQVIVIASAMPFAAWLLSAFACLLVGGGCGRGRRRRFGFSSEETLFPFPDFALEVTNLLGPIGFALDGPLMLSLPIIRLLT